MTNQRLLNKIALLEENVADLKNILHKIVNDMYSLSILDGNRTEFSDELQSQIELWKEDVNTI